VEKIRFMFLEGIRVVSLIFVALLAAKAVASLGRRDREREAGRLRLLKGALYSATLVLVILGARDVGYDVAAENYLWTSEDNLTQGQVLKSYSNAARAVELRPASLLYWRALALNKLTLRQYASLLSDLPVFQSLSGGDLDEEDGYRFATCYYYTADYDKAIPFTQGLIARNHSFAAPYIVQGMAYTAQNKLPEAERSYMAVLQMFPSHQAAVEGLAHVYFLEGNRAGATGVLNETSKFPFPAETRKRFEALKVLYAQ
jgi:tetratricopeptide (TPR) repeat protein